VIVLAVWALPMLFPPAEAEFAVPTHWRIFIAVLLLAAIFYAVKGLWKDFNVTPDPYSENHDPSAEFDLPDSVVAQRADQTNAQR